MSQLKQTLSLWQLTFFGVGTMVGAGIYVLVGKVAGLAGMMAPVAFLLSGMLAGFTACSYAELGARYPQSAGAVVYVKNGLGRLWLARGVGYLVLITGVVSAASILNGFVGYLDVFIEVPDWITLCVLAFLLAIIAVIGIGESVGLITAITLLEIGGLLFVMVMSGDRLSELPARIGEMVPDLSLDTAGVLMAAAFLAFYAFVGFEDLANVAEEAKNPRRDIPRAVILALAITTVLYFLIAVVSVLSLPVDQLASSDAPLAEILAQKGQKLPYFISAISLVAVLNGALAQIIMGARVVFGMAEQGMAPRFFAHVLPKRQTPLRATVLITALILLLALAFPIVPLAKATSFIIIVVFAFVNLAMFRIKLRDPRPAGIMAFPTWFSLMGLLLCLVFVVYQVYHFLT